jgi:hypothetical protein
MAKLISSRRLQIDKANATMVIIVAAAAFVTIFSLFASKALISQRNYQARVIGEKKKALAQLKTNNENVSKLVSSYTDFVSPTTNIIGGNTTGSGDRDGDNAKIVLDALPSKYDFPALATSLEKLLTTNRRYQINSIAGSDDEVAQLAKNSATGTPTPIEMPFQISVTSDFSGLKDLMNILASSIRPINISQLSLSGNDAALTVNITARTYYQPSKSVNITTKVVK